MENTAYKESSAPPSQVDELLSAMRPIRRHPQGYRGIHLHFSQLDREHKQPYHRRSIATAFNKLVHAKDGQLFWTSTFDVIFICKDSSIAELDIAILAARRAVEDSPIVKDLVNAGKDDALCDWFDLTQDMDRFIEMAEGLKAAGKKGLEAVKADTPSLKSMINTLSDKLNHDEKPTEPTPKTEQPVETTRPLYDPIAKKENTVTPMGPIQLDQLERNLINMEITQMLSNQTAYVIVGGSKPEPIFVEHFVSVSEINNRLLPNYDILADKWLFQKLTRTFDFKLLQSLLEKDVKSNQVVSINLNVETVFTREFDKFIPVFKQRNTQPLILEMRLFDVVSDIPKYYEAREKLTRLGCRISLDAMDVQSLAVLDRDLLSVDFLKINWKSEYRNIIGSPMEEKIISAIAAHGKMRIILCHCDTEAALDFGKKVGIHMYQGFLVDKKCGP